MKRFWIAIALLAALFGLSLYHGWHLEQLTEELTQSLTQAELCARREDWAQAESLTRLAYDRWESRDTYLHVLLRHGDTDEIYSGFQEVLAFLSCRERGEYSAANARLIAHLRLISETEAFTLNNVL